MEEKYFKYGFAVFILLVVVIGLLFVFSSKPKEEKINYENIPKPEEIKNINPPEQISKENVSKETNEENTSEEKKEPIYYNQNNTNNTTNNVEQNNELEINVSPSEIPEPEIIPEIETDINITNINESSTSNMTEDIEINTIDLPDTI